MNRIEGTFEEFFESGDSDDLIYGLEQDFKTNEYISVFSNAIIIFTNSKDKINNIIQVLKENYNKFSFNKEDIDCIIKDLFIKFS